MTSTDDGGTDSRTAGPPASWADRAGALGIDVLFGLAALGCLLLIGWSAPMAGWLWWLCTVLAAAVLLAIALNRLVLPVLTGWTVGRGVFGIAVVGRDGTPVGPWRLLLRDIAHLLDTAPLFLGWLWPLLDSRGRTFADLLTGTEVRRMVGPRPDLRHTATLVVSGAAALATVAAGVGYLAVYRQQTGAAQAREQISVEGPKIVADMLSYSAASVADDFAHDQTLVTDAYRPQLSEQQDAVRKVGPVDNQYWTSNSAVLTAAPGRASMLLLLQGQRGAAPKQRLITASVRADFVRSGSAQWQVDNLTVLGPPKPQTPPPPPAPAPAAPAETTAKPPAKAPAKPPAKAPAKNEGGR